MLISLHGVSHGVVGFSPTQRYPSGPTLTSRSSPAALFATTDVDVTSKETKKVDPLQHVATIAATLALGWTIGTAPSVAYDYSTPTSAMTSSSVQLGGNYKDSDYADFSLPSYQETVAAELNSNLKGGKELLGDDYKEAISSSASSKNGAAAAQKKEPTADEIKAEKAAAKAATKAAREAQQAAVEAALAAKK